MEFREEFSPYIKNDNTSLESELVALFLDLDGFLNVEWIRKHNEFFTVIDPKILASLFDVKREREWITWVLAQPSPLFDSFWILCDFLIGEKWENSAV